MQADYGGTETRRALNTVFSQRNGGIPTVIFLLTDGEVSSILPKITACLPVSRLEPRCW